MRHFCKRCGSPVLVNGECSAAEQHSVGFFEAMRRAHPVKLGEVIDGKRVVETFWQSVAAVQIRTDPLEKA